MENDVVPDKEPTRWRVIDGRTKTTVGEYSSRKRAQNVADKKDNEYGAIRYRVKPLYPGEEVEGYAKGGMVRGCGKATKGRGKVRMY